MSVKDTLGGDVLEPTNGREDHSSVMPQRLRILLVEDDPDMREMAAMFFEMLGHECDAVPDAESAREALRAARFHVLFTDVKLPRGSGTELAAEARRADAELRVVVASGYGKDIEAELEAVPGAIVLEKPYDLEDIRAALAAAVSPDGRELAASS